MSLTRAVRYASSLSHGQPPLSRLLSVALIAMCKRSCSRARKADDRRRTTSTRVLPCLQTHIPSRRKKNPHHLHSLENNPGNQGEEGTQGIKAKADIIHPAAKRSSSSTSSSARYTIHPIACLMDDDGKAPKTPTQGGNACPQV